MKNYIYASLILSSSLALADTPVSTAPTPQQTPVTTQPKGTITPTVAPRVQNGWDLALDADFIWWKAEVSGLSFAEIDRKVQSPSSSFEPGFKVGVGLDLDFDGWDAYAEYTWFREPWHKSCHSSKNHVSYSSFVHVNTSDGTHSSLILSDACSQRKAQFNIVDLELGRNFFISKRLTLRPNFGFKLARMLEKTNFTQNEEGLSGFVNLDLRQTLSGIGTRAGIDTVWHISRTFGFYGDIAVTALWSSIHNHCTSHYRADFITTNNAPKTVTQTILPVIETSVGLSYMNWFYNEAYQLYAKAGWEEQIWISYNNNAPSGTVNNTGNLTLHGLTLKLGFVF